MGPVYRVARKACGGFISPYDFSLRGEIVGKIFGDDVECQRILTLAMHAELDIWRNEDGDTLIDSVGCALRHHGAASGCAIKEPLFLVGRIDPGINNTLTPGKRSEAEQLDVGENCTFPCRMHLVGAHQRSQDVAFDDSTEQATVIRFTVVAHVHVDIRFRFRVIGTGIELIIDPLLCLSDAECNEYQQHCHTQCDYLFHYLLLLMALVHESVDFGLSFSLSSLGL